MEQHVNSEQDQSSHFQLKKAWEDEGRREPVTVKISEAVGHDGMIREEKMLCGHGETHERAADRRRSESGAKILTPELVVVAAALRLPAAVSGLADVAAVVDALAVH